jgi:hypothetical protein
MQRSFMVPYDVETTRDRFVREFVQRRGGSVGLETSTAGHVDARRRFALAIQGWESNQWIRPFLTRLEGHFERSPNNDYTLVVFVTRGLTLPLTVISLLIPYYIIRAVVPGWEGVEPAISEIVLVVISVLIVPLVWLMFFFIERQTHRLLIDALLAVYDRPPFQE